jgi:CPA2 family monovalent cation:H+ antiporter-2
VLVPVILAVVLTLVLNTAGGQLIAVLNRLTPAEGLNVSAMLQNRGEFALILATLAAGSGLDSRLTPFAGLYVLIMAIVGPVLAVNSERIGGLFGRRRRRIATSPHADVEREAELALAEAAMSGDDLPEAFEIAAGESPEEEAAAAKEEAELEAEIAAVDADTDDRDTARRRDPEY